MNLLYFFQNFLSILSKDCILKNAILSHILRYIIGDSVKFIEKILQIF